MGREGVLQILRLPPDFLSALVGSVDDVRLSLKKAAYEAVDECSVVGNTEFAPNEQPAWLPKRGKRHTLVGRQISHFLTSLAPWTSARLGGSRQSGGRNDVVIRERVPLQYLTGNFMFASGVWKRI
jgi:hypothetical protein